MYVYVYFSHCVTYTYCKCLINSELKESLSRSLLLFCCVFYMFPDVVYFVCVFVMSYEVFVFLFLRVFLVLCDQIVVFLV